MSRVIVVGGGLSGLSAAHTVIQSGGRVTLLEKNSFMGGNSTKATSGINGAQTATQRRLETADSPETFMRDTALSASGGKSSAPYPLGKVLTYNSAPAVEWLIEKFGLDLSLLGRLGGHSYPRTHRGKERFPGMTITYALMQKLEAIAKESPKTAKIVVKARVTKLLKTNGKVTGVVYTHNGKEHTEHGMVILASGGYGAGGLSDKSILHEVRPDLTHLPTTNGDHCTGDGITVALDVGADAVGLEHVQVHPTGLVNPKDPEARVKFLAAEALRGCGGLILDRNGKRIADELGRRDYVSGQMFKNQGPFRLVLNSAAGREIEWHVKHYTGRGLMKHFNHASEMAKDMGISTSVLEDTFTKYNAAAKVGKDEFGKKFYPNLPLKVDDSFWVAVITPVVHYTMGGLRIGTDASVLDKNEQPIPGLFAAGEVTGGVHGKNRLGGSALLECVVFGRVAGASAARTLLNAALDGSGISMGDANGFIGAQVSQPGVSTRVSVDPSGRSVNLTVSWDESKGGASQSAAPANAAVEETKEEAPAAKPAQKEYTLADVAKHNTESDCWVVVNGEVLDVTTFLADHPGGKQAILLFAGKDATDEFNMLHAKDVVEKYAPHCIIGTLSAGGSSGSGAGSNSGLQAEAIFAELAKRITPELVSSVGVVYRFDVTGDAGSKSWVVDLKNGGGKITEGEGSADCTIKIKDQDFVALMSGKLNPQSAFMQGKLKISGNMMLAMKLDALMAQQSKL